MSTMLSNSKKSKNTRIPSKLLSLFYGEKRLHWKESDPLTNLLLNVYQKRRQSDSIYKLKAELRQKIYSLLSNSIGEKIDLYMIGSSLTDLGSNNSDADLCLIIYDSNYNIDQKYEEKSNAILKLNELSKILQLNGISISPKVIPALVPILKFETSSGVEVNINLNRIVTIRNTHLLYTYSRIDWRVSPLILCVKLWARKNAINCAYTKSLTSYSLSLMVIYFLQSVCNPPVVPCLLTLYPQLFTQNVTKLRLGDVSMIRFITRNKQSLGQLFSGFMEYFGINFTFRDVISIRTGLLLDRNFCKHKIENSEKPRQFTCHICIEEPFDGSNTSHAVHDCNVFRHILFAFMETFQAIKNKKLLTIDHFI